MNFFKILFVNFLFFSLFFANNTFADSFFNIENKDIVNNVFSLEGNWDFYWNKLISNEFDLKNNKPDEIVKIPSRWTHEKKYNQNGCATYRAVINVPYDGIYSIIVPFLEHSYNIYANNVLILSDGFVSCQKEFYKPGRSKQIVSVLSKNKKIELNVQISSFDDIYAGMQDVIRIGKPNVIAKDSEKSIAINVSILSAILIMAIYHLIMFLKRKKDVSFLIFFFFSFSIIIRLIFADFFAKWLFPNISYDFIMRMCFLSIVLAPVFLVMFTRYLFYPEKTKSNMLRVSIFYLISASAPILFLPVKIFSRFLHFYEIGLVIISLLAFYHLIRALYYRKDGALILLCGSAILFFFALNDIFYINGVLNTGLFAPFGLIIFILCQSFVLAKKYNKISELYLKDFLTGAYNKRYLFDYLEDAINVCKKNERKSISIAILDIDYFKNINDTYGHDFGDIVLKNISEAIVQSIRGNDVFARYGGEEFVIIFNDLKFKDSFVVCEKIREKISKLETVFIDKNNKKQYIKVTISIGLSDYDRSKHVSYNQVLKLADDCLYNAKNSGRNKVVSNFDN